jgi:squalene-hopene/tetraprenyl-beta-curcumene cyclase
MLDPTCPDITGRVLEALCRRGMKAWEPAAVRAIDYLLRSQRQDGSWFGRWGVNYVYGTFLAIRGLKATGDPQVRDAIDRGLQFLRSSQNPDGGWGESCASYVEHRFVPARSTASQTAWAVIGLLAGGDRTSASVNRGIQYLTDTQREDGGWDEPQTTGTGFPGVFYLRYHLYAQYFPLLALAQFSAREPERLQAWA